MLMVKFVEHGKAIIPYCFQQSLLGENATTVYMCENHDLLCLCFVYNQAVSTHIFRVTATLPFLSE